MDVKYFDLTPLVGGLLIVVGRFGIKWAKAQFKEGAR